MQSDSNELIAYVMTHNRMTQAQAMAWLDKRMPTWRSEPPPEIVGVIYYDGPSDGYEDE